MGARSRPFFGGEDPIAVAIQDAGGSEPWRGSGDLGSTEPKIAL